MGKMKAKLCNSLTYIIKYSRQSAGSLTVLQNALNSDTAFKFRPKIVIQKWKLVVRFSQSLVIMQ